MKEVYILLDHNAGWHTAFSTEEKLKCFLKDYKKDMIEQNYEIAEDDYSAYKVLIDTTYDANKNNCELLDL